MATALFLNGVRDVRVGPYDLQPKPDEVAVDVAAVGICGSDLHYYKDGGIGSAVITKPFVPGHEFAGWLVDDLPGLGLRRGDLVAVDPALPCGRCEHCLSGHHNVCPNVRFTGAPPFDGALTERVWVDESQIYGLPEGFTIEQAVMLEPLGVSIHGIRHARPRLLEDVAVIGCGPIGLGMLALARLAGVGRIIAVDPVDYRAELARHYGADVVGGSIEAVLDVTNGRGCDLVLEATNAPQGFDDAVKAAVIGGRIVLVGIPDGDRYGLVASSARRRELTIQFSRRMGDVYPDAIKLVAGGKVDVDAMVSHRLELEEGPRAFEIQTAFQDRAVKSLIYPRGIGSAGNGGGLR